jgi:hypothetical protein
MAALPPQLDYAPPPPWRQRRRIRRVILVATLLLGLLASFKWVGPAWVHVRLLYFQHRCLTHQASPAQAVFDANAKNYPSTDWDQFYTLFSPPGGRFEATIFLGQLFQPDGTARLIAINIPHSPSASSNSSILFDIHVIRPATFWSGARLCTNSQWRAGDSQQGEDRYERVIQQIYAGQPIPPRTDHFTIQLNTSKGPRTIDGWLQSDDTILLEYRRLDRSISN